MHSLEKDVGNEKIWLSFTVQGAAHSNDSGRYGKSASQNRPSLLKQILTERAVYAQWGRPHRRELKSICNNLHKNVTFWLRGRWERKFAPSAVTAPECKKP